MRILEVRARKDLGRALGLLRKRLYRSLPGWHDPPLRLDLDRYDFGRNPFWRNHEGQTLFAEDSQGMAGRVTVFCSKTGGASTGETSRVGRFGGLECIDDASLHSALWDLAESWLRQRGCRRVEGPFTLSAHEEVGVLTQGFDTPASLMMAYNPPHMASLLESRGFQEVRRFVTYRYDLERSYETATSDSEAPPGLSVRSFSLERRDEEVQSLLRIYNSAFSGNWGFSPLSELECDAMVGQFLTIGDPVLVRIAELGGKAVGFLLCFPDLNRLLHRWKGWPDVVKIAVLIGTLKLSRVRDCRVMTLAVEKQYQGQGIARQLVRSLASEALRHGYGNAELSYIDSENQAMVKMLDGYQFHREKEYRVYARDL